jgi:hypothetical protein
MTTQERKPTLLTPAPNGLSAEPDTDIPVNSVPPFEISKFELDTISRTCVARADLRVGPILIRKVRLHRTRFGVLYLGMPGYRQIDAPGGWAAHCIFDAAFAEAVRDAFKARLSVEESASPPRSDGAG